MTGFSANKKTPEGVYTGCASVCKDYFEWSWTVVRPANSHGFTVRLTVWGINSRSHDLASESHGESENLEIAKQFR